MVSIHVDLQTRVYMQTRVSTCVDRSAIIAIFPAVAEELIFSGTARNVAVSHRKKIVLRPATLQFVKLESQWTSPKYALMFCGWDKNCPIVITTIIKVKDDVGVLAKYLDSLRPSL